VKRLFFALILPALALAWMVQLAGLANADFLDEFSVPQLNPGWRIVRPDSAHWSLTARPGFLRIMAQYDPGGQGAPTNTFGYFEVISGNFEVSVKLIARPDSAGQLVMLIAGYDTLSSGNPPAMLGFGNDHNNKLVFGQINDTNNTAPYSDTLVYLRVRTRGDTAFAEYSPNNSNWTVVKSGWSPPFTRHQFSGVFAVIWPELGGTTQTPEMNADFDWYHLVARTGVEEERRQGDKGTRGQGVKVTPDPFSSFARVLGHEGERFSLYDISGRQVGVYKGDRIGEGLVPGVYFLRPQDRLSSPVRVVKVR